MESVSDKMSSKHVKVKVICTRINLSTMVRSARSNMAKHFFSVNWAVGNGRVRIPSDQTKTMTKTQNIYTIEKSDLQSHSVQVNNGQVIVFSNINVLSGEMQKQMRYYFFLSTVYIDMAKNRNFVHRNGIMFSFYVRIPLMPKKNYGTG